MHYRLSILQRSHVDDSRKTGGMQVRNKRVTGSTRGFRELLLHRSALSTCTQFTSLSHGKPSIRAASDTHVFASGMTIRRTVNESPVNRVGTKYKGFIVVKLQTPSRQILPEIGFCPDDQLAPYLASWPLCGSRGQRNHRSSGVDVRRMHASAAVS